MVVFKCKVFQSALSAVLCMILLFSPLSPIVFAEGENSPVAQEAPATRSAMVKGDAVHVRSGAGTNFSPLTHNGEKIFLFSGHELTVKGDSVPDSVGDPWFFVSFTYSGTAYEGYIHGRYVVIRSTADIPVVENLKFEEQLKAFPEAYHRALKAIHEAHPSWHFEAFDTGLDWAEVQRNENVPGRSLTNSRYASHYSTTHGYDWETDTFYAMEAGTWFQANPSLVAYYMDPRNFLNEDDIFQFEKLTFSSASQTLESVEAMLKGSFMEGKTILDDQANPISYGAAFLKAAESANVSAFHLVTRCIQEVGWSGSSCAHGNYPGYEGYYNFFNIGANSGATDGMIHAKAQGWDSPYKAIMAGGSFIGSDYIARGQNTPYFQKFSVVDPKYYYWHQYMTNIAAAHSESKLQGGTYEALGYMESSFVFRIPLYKNMPEKLCAEPTPAGSPNNYLTSITVEGYALTPTFDFYDTLHNGTSSYTIIINEDVSSIRVSATAASKVASLSGSLGNVSIWTGENVLKIKCTSAAGETRTYTLRVILNGKGADGTPPPEEPEEPSTPNPPPVSPEEPKPVPSGWNPPYRIQGQMISGIPMGTSVGDFLAKLGVYGKAAATLSDENGAVVSGGAVRTGHLLSYYDGSTTLKFTLVMFGDINKDSVMDAIDLLMVRRNLLGITDLDSSASQAADVNRDGKVDAIDLLLVRKSLLGLTTITQ